MLKLFLILSLLISILSSGLVLERHSYASNKSLDSIITIHLSFVGDIMCHTPQIEYARVSKDSFDFKPVFREIEKYLKEPDVTFGNFETVTAGESEIFSGYPLFNSPDHLLEAISSSGFDVLFTSNNHSLDRGVNGVIRTLKKIKEYNMTAVGTSDDLSSGSVVILNVKGITIGILSYTYGLNGNYLPKSKSYIVNLIDTFAMKNDIQKMNEKKVDLILTYFHFGEEYSREPSNFQKEIVNKTYEYGADIIIGSHPHVIQKIEMKEKDNGKLDKGLVAYSLGNFISNQRWRYSDAGVILNLEIKKNIKTDSLWIDNVSVIPTWVFKGNTGSKNEFVILPSDTTTLNPIPAYLSKNDKFRMQESYRDTDSILFKK